MVERVSGSSNGEKNTKLAWYCLRSRQKQEHIAAAHVRVLGNVSVFCPRIRFRRMTRGGRVWVTDALFPGYFFARFSLGELLLRVRSAHGVSSIVRFGERYPVIPDSIIEDLKDGGDGLAIREVGPDLVPGERVKLAEGALAGWEGVITEVLPGNERVRLLLEFLGRETVAEARVENLLPGQISGLRVLRFATRLSRVQPAVS
jgi:transcriptional antiterminator RfaH